MILSRRVVMTGLVAWTAALAFTPLADWRTSKAGSAPGADRGKLTVVYVGADDCAPCLRWRRERRPAFQSSSAFSRVEYREVIAASLMTALDDRFWPENLRNLRDVVGKDGGGVPHWILLRNGRVLASEGGESAWDRKIWPLIVLES